MGPYQWAWSLHPSVLIGTGLLGALYFWGIGPLRRRLLLAPAPPPACQIASFSGGLLVLLVALNGPMHDLSDYYLFSAHMVQHLLLTLLLPPLLIAGTPGWLLRPLLQRPAALAVARIQRTLSSGESSQPGVPAMRSGGSSRVSRRCCTMWAEKR